LRLDAGRVALVQTALAGAGLACTAVESGEAGEKVPFLLLNDLVLDAHCCEGVDAEGKTVSRPWAGLIAAAAARVKSRAVHSLDESSVEEDARRRTLHRHLGASAVPRHDPVADRAERAESREASTPPEPVLDLFFKAPALVWYRIPLLRLRFAGAGLEPTARRNLERWLTHLHAGARTPRYAGELKPRLTRLEHEKWPTLEPHAFDRFARWVTYHSRNR